MVTVEQILHINAPVERCFDLARSIDVHLLGTERTGEQAVAGVTTGLIGMGQSVRWKARHLGVVQYLTSRITAYEAPHHFQDTMVEGAFQSLRHDHFFRGLAAGGTEMRDMLCFSAPLAGLGRVAEVLFLKRYMANFLRRRNEILKAVAESEDWARFLPS